MTSPQQHRILIVDDEENMRFFLREALSKQGYEVDTADSGPAALEKIVASPFDVVIMDIRMARMTGLETLSEIHKINPTIPVILMTAYGSRQTAVEAVQKGAYDYFTKPFDINEMRIVVKRALEKQRLEEEVRTLRSQLADRHEFHGIIGSTPEMQELFEMVERVVNNDVTVIIYGESGTGKELMAHVIHHNSHRRDKPFIKINCAAIPETLLESELFGYEKGAFTGAAARKIGKFEAADKGTLFLDEIGDMSLATQAKLLRALEEREIERVGGNETIHVDIRIIAATNQKLQQAVQEKRFREDLYFRLNVIPIFIPPLRARRSDLPMLVDHFLADSNAKFHKNISGFTPEAMRCLMTHDWPGNVRELENLIQRAVVLCSGTFVDVDALPPAVRTSDSGTARRNAADIDYNGESLADVVESLVESTERRIIEETLARTDWSRKRTAELLKICRKSLHNKMKKYGLSDADAEADAEDEETEVH